MIEAVLMDSMGDDKTVVNAARVSFGVAREGDMTERDVGLIKFLAREKHVTPFRHAQVSFRCKAPIAIARQLGKHQVGFSWNELSRRYKDGNVDVFIPETIFKRPSNLHDGSGKPIKGDDLEDVLTAFESAYQESLSAYDYLLERIAPEQARFVLPQGMITEWIWTGSLYGWFELYRQRISTHAQYETRCFAKCIDNEMSKLFPIAWNALKETISEDSNN